MKKKTTIGQMGERRLIAEISRWIGRDFIGDDCAILPFPDSQNILATSDVLVSGVHFNIPSSTWAAVGFKAISVNVSDIAAMGGRSKFALVSLGLRPDLLFEDFKKLYQGLKRAADFFGLIIAGGNLSRSPVNFVDIFMTGEPTGGNILRRSGVRPGDRLFLTGRLGKAAAKKFRVTEKDFRQIRQAEGIFMARHNLASAAIDLSDGLAESLRELAAKSQVGFRICVEKIPFVRGVSPGESLTAGDDFELLFSVPAALSEKAQKLFQENFKTPLAEIGEATSVRKTIYLKKGQPIKITGDGFEHF